MKKFNFLAVLVTALIMILGLNVQAQNMVEPINGAHLVQSAIEALTKNAASPAAMASLSRESIVSNLRVAVGQEMIPMLKQGMDVNSAIATSVQKFRSNRAEQNAQLAEVELHYRNLLRKPF